MIAAEETFDGTWPYPARFNQAAGFRQHYVDEGPEQPDQTIVMLHGEPTWGYEWRHLIGPLSRHHRVVVPDHMGFGKSETPQDRTYDASEHILNLESLLVDTLDLTDITLVLRDWGGPIGTGFALRHPDRISRIFATNTVLPLADDIAPLMKANGVESRWFQWARSALSDGSFEQILGNAGHTIAHLMIDLQHVARPEIATPTWIRAYSSPFRPRRNAAVSSPSPGRSWRARRAPARAAAHGSRRRAARRVGDAGGIKTIEQVLPDAFGPRTLDAYRRNHTT